MISLTVNVLGTPVQQGSKSAFYRPELGRAVNFDTNAKKLKPWRNEVSGCVLAAMRETGWQTLDAPVQVELIFFHPRAKSHYGTGRNAGVLKATAPFWKSTAPDIDKLTRAVLDALTDAAAFRDDARVARLVVEDRWADAESGVRITLTPLNSVPVDVPQASASAGTGHTEGALF